MSYIPPPSSLPPGSIVDSYRRDSGGMRQDASTDQQLAEIESYCQQYGLIHRHRFVDVAKSGGTTVGRDDFNRMIDSTRHVEDRPAAILLWNYARVFASADLDTQRLLLRLLIDRVEVRREDKMLYGTIYYYYPPPKVHGLAGMDDVSIFQSPSGPPLYRHILKMEFHSQTKYPSHN